MPSKPSRAARAFERRMFLKAVALGMSVPAAARLARVATAAPTAAPKRFFLFYTPHGTAPEHYAPKLTNPVDPTKQAVYTDFALDQTNVSILGPLQPYKQYVNVYQGFQYPERVGTTHEGIVNCLSGVLASDGGGVTDTTMPRTTIDQLIGKAPAGPRQPSPGHDRQVEPQGRRPHDHAGARDGRPRPTRRPRSSVLRAAIVAFARLPPLTTLVRARGQLP